MVDTGNSKFYIAKNQKNCENNKENLFEVLFLVEWNCFNRHADKRSVFPEGVPIPNHIDSLIFPEYTNQEDNSPSPEDLLYSRSQCYSLVLTDEKGQRKYGYCRRVLPEGAFCCLPLCYCIISLYRAPLFYYQILKEIESYHGNLDIDLNDILKQLWTTKFPTPDQLIHFKYWKCDKARDYPFFRINNNGNSLVKKYIGRSLNEPCVLVLLDSLGVDVLVKVFHSLLMEDKVVIVSDKLSQLSSCMEALQLILYPFVWSHTIVSTMPMSTAKGLLESPVPILAGVLKRSDDKDDLINVGVLEGIIVDISEMPSKIIYNNNTPVLTTYRNLKEKLLMRYCQVFGLTEKERNIRVNNAFMHFFLDVMGNITDYFTIETVLDMSEKKYANRNVVFNEQSFITRLSRNSEFLKKFIKTAMFQFFIKDIVSSLTTQRQMALPTPNFYNLFHKKMGKKYKDYSKNIRKKSIYSF